MILFLLGLGLKGLNPPQVFSTMLAFVCCVANDHVNAVDVYLRSISSLCLFTISTLNHAHPFFWIGQSKSKKIITLCQQCVPFTVLFSSLWMWLICIERRLLLARYVILLFFSLSPYLVLLFSSLSVCAAPEKKGQPKHKRGQRRICKGGQSKFF